MSAEPDYDLRALLGLGPTAEPLTKYLQSIKALLNSSEDVNPEIKIYSDAVYLNYYALGLSLMFKPISGYKPAKGSTLAQLDGSKLLLDEIDLYNPPKAGSRSKDKSSRSAEQSFSPFPATSFTLGVGGTKKGPDGKEEERPECLKITKETNGKDFVECLGEPDRKGGGSGPSSGSIGIWCEWTKDGTMVEFGGEEARGPQAWERGKDAIWKVIQIFPAPT